MVLQTSNSSWWLIKEFYFELYVLAIFPWTLRLFPWEQKMSKDNPIVMVYLMVKCFLDFALWRKKLLRTDGKQRRKIYFRLKESLHFHNYCRYQCNDWQEIEETYDNVDFQEMIRKNQMSSLDFWWLIAAIGLSLKWKWQVN